VMDPAAFTACTGKDHWQVLLQGKGDLRTPLRLGARADRLHYGRRQTHGHALVIDPLGTVLAGRWSCRFGAGRGTDRIPAMARRSGAPDAEA